MVSLKHKYFLLQGVCASVSIGAIGILAYFGSHGFTNLVGSSARNMSAIYMTGELKSLHWKEMTGIREYEQNLIPFAVFEATSEKVSTLAKSIESRSDGASRSAIAEFIAIHAEARKSIREDSKHALNRKALETTVALYDRGYEKLNEFGDQTLLGSQDEQGQAIRTTSRAMKVAIFASGSATGLILLLSFLYLKKYIVNPIVAISSASLDAARGEYRSIPESGSGDEIHILATNFNYMVAEIHKATGELGELNRTLEAKVEERTAQLMDAEVKLLTTAKMSALGEMAGGVAHEINTPLGTISLVTEQIRELVGEDPIDRTTVLKMTDTVSMTVRRISGIVKGLRTFSRDGSEDPLLPTPVRQIVEETLMLCGEKLKHANIVVQVEPIGEDLLVRCRSVQISQVILNLVSNACDAIKPLPEKWIRISAEAKGDRVVISVTDSGNGISEKVRARLFQPFFTTKEIGKGTGLGLSISKGILAAHRGTLDVDFASKNTRFVVDLPTNGGQESAPRKRSA
jgi:signal transduction histidine kinase